jgi:hypothetical protein
VQLQGQAQQLQMPLQMQVWEQQLQATAAGPAAPQAAGCPQQVAVGRSSCNQQQQQQQKQQQTRQQQRQRQQQQQQLRMSLLHRRRVVQAV